jgi:glycosyltransferase involved in cell wall biosynthesis
MTGANQDWRDPDYTHQVAQSIKDCNFIHNLGLVSRSDVDALFRKAISIAQPSLYEGWSTSIEEGICSGAGIIASSIDLHIEQLKEVENAKLFQVDSSDELINLLFNHPLRVSELEAKSQQVFRWRRFKSELRDVINQSQNDILFP